MRVAWLTDIHLDFLDPAARAGLAATVRAEQPDTVVVTGDIAIAPTVLDLIEQLAAGCGAPLHYVLGNHDYYRGSIADVRARAAATTAGRSRWLHAGGVVRLDATTALVGVDGWGDARLGNFVTTRVMLNDFIFIEELSGISRGALRERLEAYGDESATRLRALLAEALAWAEHVVVATHVPPFREACWHEGAISNDDWLPFFTCKATGDVLRETFAAHPRARATVLCGHTHSSGQADLLPNLRVLTGAAEYGAPRIQQVIEL
ncbi:MAG TPA: metallophosphoesterase [Kofleriaceae bacterium]|nr:metallophosphoesterase [Kofleriaceae bacterium]